MLLVSVKRIYRTDHSLNIILKWVFTLKMVDFDFFGEKKGMISLNGLTQQYPLHQVRIALLPLSLSPMKPAKEGSRIFNSKFPFLEFFLKYFKKVFGIFKLGILFIV